MNETSGNPNPPVEVGYADPPLLEDGLATAYRVDRVLDGFRMATENDDIVIENREDEATAENIVGYSMKMNLPSAQGLANFFKSALGISITTIGVALIVGVIIVLVVVLK